MNCSIYINHLNMVRARWQLKYKASGQTAAEFRKLATDTLKSYGWDDKEIKHILRGIK